MTKEEQFNNIKDSYELAMAQGWDIGAIESMIEKYGIGRRRNRRMLVVRRK